MVCSWIERKSQDDLIFIMDTLSKYYKSSLPITIGADKQYAVQVDDQSSVTVTASDCSQQSDLRVPALYCDGFMEYTYCTVKAFFFFINKINKKNCFC